MSNLTVYSFLEIVEVTCYSIRRVFSYDGIKFCSSEISSLYFAVLKCIQIRSVLVFCSWIPHMSWFQLLNVNSCEYWALENKVSWVTVKRIVGALKGTAAAHRRSPFLLVIPCSYEFITWRSLFSSFSVTVCFKNQMQLAYFFWIHLLVHCKTLIKFYMCLV